MLGGVTTVVMGKGDPMSANAMVMQWKIKAGRLGDFLAQQREFKTQMTGIPGGPSYRLWGTTSGAGEEPHTTATLVMEFESGGALGQYIDAVTSDQKGYEEMMNTSFGPDAPAVQIGVSTVHELALD